MLAIDRIQRRRGILEAFDALELERAPLVREVDEVAIGQAQKLQIILGLNSVGLTKLAYRLQLYDVFAIDYEIGPDVPDVLTFVEHRYDPLGLIVDFA